MDEPVVTKTNSPDWDFLLDTLKEEKCILLLGPDIIKVSDLNDSGKVHSVQNALLDYLNAYQDSNILKYYSQDELFLFKDMPSQTKTYYKIKAFYAKATVKRTIYENITKIPFPLIVSVSPDTYLKQAFKAMKFPHRFEVYNKTQAPHDITAPIGQDPVIYNLFGCTEEEESLVLTHDGLFDFLSAIMGPNKLPIEVANTFQRATNIIFLGFKFEKWYVQLLLRLLKIHNPLYRSSKYSIKTDSTGESEIEDLCRAQFSINFIDTQLEDFIETLCEKCREEGLLRGVENTSLISVELHRIRQIITNDKIGEAFTELTKVLKGDYPFSNSSNNDMLDNIQGSYNYFEQNRMKGILSNSEQQTQMNNIRTRLIDFISFLENQ
ncbi:SIR2 family protein [Mucilaginibacter lappiensis]|uniref:SIR2 family protein n=1 Tax=Mucilaginibacter lappiensis TaxID=354630 RepID=UPI003D1FC6D1